MTEHGSFGRLQSGKRMESFRLNKASISKAEQDLILTMAQVFLIMGEKTCILWDFRQKKQLGMAIANSAILELAIFSKGIICIVKVVK